MSNVILERYEQSRLYDPKGYACIGYVYFLLGRDREEIHREPGILEENDLGLIRVRSLNQANAIGIEARAIGREARSKPGKIEHLAVIHPFSKYEIIHRDGNDEIPTIDSIDAVLQWTAHTDKFKHILFELT